MRHVLQTEGTLDRVDLCRVSAREHLVDVRDDGLNVGGAVLRHVAPDGVEVLPEVSDGLDDGR